MKFKLGVIILVLGAILWCTYMYIHVTNPQLTQMQMFQSHWGYALYVGVHFGWWWTGVI